MINDVKDYLVAIAIGIRFRANFALEDKLGKIVDDILYTKDSLFNPLMFPTVVSDPVEKRLINETTGDSLRINASNVILELNIGDSIKVTDVAKINDSFHRDIVKGVLEKSEVTQINRVGYINKYLFNIEELSNVFVNKTIGNTLEGVNDINLRFSKKFPIQESLTKRNVNDYHNVIFNIIKKVDKEEIFFSVDYQRYFDPLLDRASQLEFPKFLSDVEHYNSLNYVKWLNAYYGKNDEKQK